MPADRGHHPYSGQATGAQLPATSAASGPGYDGALAFDWPASTGQLVDLDPAPPPIQEQQQQQQQQQQTVYKIRSKKSKPLNRNQACKTCRGRKVRCDATKPGCGACKRSAAAHGEDPELVVCEYEEEDFPPAPSGEPAKPKKASAKIAALEEKIAELERLIEAHNIKSDDPKSSSTSPKGRPRSPSSTSSSKADSQEPGPSAVVVTAGAVVPDSNGAADPLLEVFYPGWPSSLPHPNVVAYVVNVFITRCRRTEGSIQVDPAAFRVALDRAPSSAGFPHLGLIHSMMALAYREWGGDELALQLNGGHRYWIKGSGEGPVGTGKAGGRVKDCADYHAAWATRAVEDSLAKGFHLFQMSQAINILCSFFYVSARFVEVWIYCGLATRISTPLGLNHLESCADYTTGAKIRPRSLMPPPATLEEKYRRSVTFWLAFLNDRYASAAASWAHSLDERDISTLLPSAPGTTGATLDEVDLRTHPLSISNPDFFSVHPPDMDELQMELKCTILLGRINMWLQRAPTPIGAFLSRIPNPVQTPVPDLRPTPEYIKLDQDLSALRLSTPRPMLDIFNPLTGKVDSSRVLINLIPHTATILLHEAFCTRRLGDAEHERCMGAARAIMHVTYQLLASSSDFRMLSCFTSFCWSIAGRAFIREMAMSELRGDVEATQAAAREVDTLLVALTSIGQTARLGLSGAGILRHTIAKRSNLLPLDSLADPNAVDPQPALGGGREAAAQVAHLPGTELGGFDAMQDVLADPSWAALLPRGPDGSLMSFDNYPSDAQLQELDPAFLDSLVPEPLDATAFLTTSAG